MDKVVVVTTGGTIASTRPAAGEALVSSMAGAALLETMGSLAPPMALELEEFCNIGSYAMDLETSFRLARRVGSILADPDTRGVVVTHGTDTMEEAAFLADLVVRSDKPVVFTGAQRDAMAPDADGPRNMADAIRVAVTLQARGMGAVIVFDGEIHAARDVTKLHCSRVGAFASGEHGMLGTVDGVRVVVHRRPVLRLGVDAERIETRVDLIRLVMGSDARFLQCAIQTGARGVVLEAFGRGNVTPDVLDGVAAAVSAGVAVVVTSRCPQGRAMPVYGGSGGSGVRAAGAIFAGDLAGLKARILLSLLLGHGVTDIASAFETVAG